MTLTSATLIAGDLDFADFLSESEMQCLVKDPLLLSREDAWLDFSDSIPVNSSILFAIRSSALILDIYAEVLLHCPGHIRAMDPMLSCFDEASGLSPIMPSLHWSPPPPSPSSTSTPTHPSVDPLLDDSSIGDNFKHSEGFSNVEEASREGKIGKTCLACVRMAS